MDGDGDIIVLIGKVNVVVWDDIVELDVGIVRIVCVDEMYGDYSDNVYVEVMDLYCLNVMVFFENVVDLIGLDFDFENGFIYVCDWVVGYDIVGVDDFGGMVEVMFKIDNVVFGLIIIVGEIIVLMLEGGLIVGWIDGGINDGDVVFVIYINDNGCVSIVQYQLLFYLDILILDEYIDFDGKIFVVVIVIDVDGDIVI